MLYFPFWRTFQIESPDGFFHIFFSHAHPGADLADALMDHGHRNIPALQGLENPAEGPVVMRHAVAHQHNTGKAGVCTSGGWTAPRTAALAANSSSSCSYSRCPPKADMGATDSQSLGVHTTMGPGGPEDLSGQTRSLLGVLPLQRPQTIPLPAAMPAKMEKFSCFTAVLVIMVPG